MDAENLVVDNCGNWEAIEALNKLLPELQGISSFTLIIKPVDSVDGATFVIASQEEEVLWVLDFVCEHEADDFEILLAAIDVITQKQIIAFWWKVADLEYS